MKKTYISLLRGINVGGNKKILMKDLTEMCRKLDCDEVVTYIQSGNIIFKHEGQDSAALEKVLEEAIKATFNFEVPVITVSVNELNTILTNNPFIVNENQDVNLLHVAFLKTEPDPKLIAAIPSDFSGDDRFVIQGKTIYIICPNGFGNTKLTNSFFDKKLKTTSTVRNWRTANELLKLAAEK